MYIQYCLALMEICIMVCVNKYKVLTNPVACCLFNLAFAFERHGLIIV